jgi:hypothetical protein
MSNVPANQKKTDNRSATQKLSDLENAVLSLYNVSDNLARDFMVLKDAVKLLNNKVNAIVQASAGGEELTDPVLDRIMVENNISELKEKVDNMVLQSVIAPETQVSENSFIVGSELDTDGTVKNPRVQFALKALSPELQGKIKGANVGDTLHLQDGKLDFKILESYAILPPQAPAAAPAATSTETTAPTEAAPADSSAAAPAAPTTATTAN